MLRGARNPYATALLVLAGVVIAIATGAVVVAPGGGEPTAAETVATADSSAPTTAVPESTVAQPVPPASTTSTVAPVEPAVATVPQPVQTSPYVIPTRVRIEKIGVDATMIDLYKKADNTLQVPEDIRITGWYTGRSVPGEPGPSVVVGHVDSAAQGAGVFYRLRELEVGDVIHVDRSDGSVAEFRVTDYELVLKTEFPTEKVYGSVEGSKLRLITCGGGFNSAAGSYLGNLIVYAEHIGTTDPIRSEPADLVS